MAKVRKKAYIGKNVYEAALDRIRHLYDTFDEVVVSFSGGKDSTAVLNCTLEVAKELGRLPVRVVFFDEEAIHPPTIEYVQRVRENPDVNLEWYCLETQHRNASSSDEPYWITWDSEKKDLWVREMPEGAITEHPNFKRGMSFQEFAPFLYPIEQGKIAMMTGIRTEESLRRLQVISKKKNDPYIQLSTERGSNQYRCFPIYDWSSKDVWTAVVKLGWDYNKFYDIVNQTKMHNKFLSQRVCPPFGEEPLRGLWMYAECFPEMWHKMLNRVPGVGSAWRYANTELYSNAKQKPDNLTYREYLDVLLKTYEGEWRKQVTDTVNRYIRYHKKKSKQAIPDDQGHPITGCSYRMLCRVVLRGDFKSRQTSAFVNEAIKVREEMDISLEQAIRRYS